MMRSLCCLAMLAMVGCSSAPSRVVAPSINPKAGADAVAKLDKNGDAAIDETEAKFAPAFLEPEAKSRADTNGDGKITREEIDARIKVWDDSGVGITQYSLTIDVDGRPVEGLEVKFVPEDWLGTEIKGGTGTTDASGRVNLAMAESDLKENEKGLQGMRLGYYKVEITHPSMMIPAKYNTATEVGFEIAPDQVDTSRNTLSITSR